MFLFTAPLTLVKTKLMEPVLHVKTYLQLQFVFAEIFYSNFFDALYFSL